MTRVFRDKWLWGFLTLAVLTLVFTASAADSGNKVLRMVTYLYNRVQAVEAKTEVVEEKAVISSEDRRHINERLDAIERAVRRLEGRQR
jgi:hypothetical protein